MNNMLVTLIYIGILFCNTCCVQHNIQEINQETCVQVYNRDPFATLIVSEIEFCDEIFEYYTTPQGLVGSNQCVENAVRHYAQVIYNSCNREYIKLALRDLVFDITGSNESWEYIENRVIQSNNLSFLFFLCKEYSCVETD